MEGLAQLVAAYIRQAWPPFAAGVAVGIILGFAGGVLL